MNGTELKYLKERFDSLEGKVDRTHDKLLQLPCDVHKEKIKGLGISVDRVWGWTKVILISILTGASVTVIIKAVMAN